MEDLKDPKMRKSRISRTYIPAGTYVLRPGTLIAAVIAVILAQMALAIPAVLNGLFQQDLGTSSSQLTWISDAFFVPVCMLELSFGVLGDLFGRKRLLVGGAIVLAIGEATAVLTPGAALPIGDRMLVLWTGEAHSRNWRGRHFSDQPRDDRGRHAHQQGAGPFDLDLGGRAVGRQLRVADPGRTGRETAFRLRSAGRLALGVPDRARPGPDQCRRLGHGRQGLLVAGGPFAGLAGAGDDRGEPVRAALRGGPGTEQRVGISGDIRGICGGRHLPAAVRPRRAQIGGSTAAPGFLQEPEFRGGLGRHDHRHVRLSWHRVFDQYPAISYSRIQPAEDRDRLPDLQRHGARSVADHDPADGKDQLEVAALRRTGADGRRRYLDGRHPDFQCCR